DAPTWDEQREAFGDNVIDTLSEYIPNLKKIIIGRQVLTPLDLEREFGLTQGNIFQGELSWNSFSFCGRSRDGRITARRWTVCTCAARRRIRAEESWARREESRARSF